MHPLDIVSFPGIIYYPTQFFYFSSANTHLLLHMHAAEWVEYEPFSSNPNIGLDSLKIHSIQARQLGVLESIPISSSIKT